MRKFFGFAVIPTLVVSILTPTVNAAEESKTNYEEKLPYMFKEPNWEKYKHGDKGVWPLPEAPPYSTGLYTMASHNSVDYKEDQNKFYETASKYKSSGNTEVYYKSNPSTSVTMELPIGGSLGKSVGGDTILEFTYSDTKVPAYNGIKGNDELVLDSSQGQWLVTNGYYSRDNTGKGVRRIGNGSNTTISASPLETNPWGKMGSSTFISPEDFLMGLSKSIYGVIQSRPVYIQTTPNRLAKKVAWNVVNSRNSDGSCGPITWTYMTGEWNVQDVSKINPAWDDQSTPACGASKIIDRGEYIVHPEGYLNNVWYRYRNDQNSFVSANVYELYFSKLLQKGILSTDTAFANATKTNSFEPNKKKASNFTFTKQFADKFFTEYQYFGKDKNGTSKYEYPIWSTELGALYSNPELNSVSLGSNITDKSIVVTPSGGKTLFEKALGSNYSLSGDSTNGVTSIQTVDNQGSIMAKNTVTIINALQLIERAMRVEDGDMSKTEADIVSKKYGAQYLDALNESDKQTVSYLLAKGVLNFENYQEYSNLYSPLSESFAYKLLYRITNKEARLKFTEVTLTDSDSLPSIFSEYKQSIVKADLSRLSVIGSLTSAGKLIKNQTNQPLTLLSDINFSHRAQRIAGNSQSKIGTRYAITADVDDIMKYLYRSMPIVNVNPAGEPIKLSGNSYKVYTSFEQKLYNDISDKDKRYVGIQSINYNPNTGRYNVVFLTYGDSYDTALRFVKANLQTRISGVSNKTEESSVISEESGTLSSTKGSDLNSSISSNNDLIVNRDFDLSAYSNSKTSIVGNNLVPGASAVKVGDKIMASLNVISKLTNTTAFENVGSKELVSIDSSQLKGLNTPVQNIDGKVVGRTTMISEKVSSKPNTKGVNDITSSVVAYSLSMLKSTDTLITDKTFTYKDDEGKTREVQGSVIISWTLDLPSELEQNSLVGSSIKPYVNDNAKSSWIFTKPTNKSLLAQWEYNVGLNNALLKTLSGNNLSIPSGYFTPTVNILLDSLNVQERDGKGNLIRYDLGKSQLEEIENNFMNDVGQNLSASWVHNYIGSVALANYKVGDKTKVGDSQKDNASLQEIKKFIDTSKSDDKGLYVKPTGMLKPLKVPNGKTVWSYLVFNQERPNESSAKYFDMHSHMPSYAMYTIYSTVNGNKFYGEYFSGTGEGVTPKLELPYAKDNFNNFYKNVDYSDYIYDSSAGVLREESSLYAPDKTGGVVNYKDEQWYVAEDKPYTLNLHSKKFISGVMKNGKLYQSTSGAMELPLILDVVHATNLKTFGKGQEKGIDSSAYMKTYGFDFTPDAESIKVDTKFIAVKNGVMKPFVYKTVVNTDGSTSLKMEETTLNDGEVVYVPSFVVLSKAVWSITGDNLVWSKKFVGADSALYTKGSLVQGLKEQLLNEESKNLVNSQDVKTGTLTIGNAVGTITDRSITFLVPFSSNMIAGNKINEQEVLDSFNTNSDVIITDSKETGSAAQYLSSKKVGKYDPYFKTYHNTLVDNKGKLQVATGTKLIDYTSSTVVDSVSLTGMIMEGVRYLNNGANSSSGSYKIHTYQTIKPPAVVAPFTNGAPPLLNADNSFVADKANDFKGLATSLELFDSLQSYLKKIAAKNAWYLVIVIILGTSILMSITTLLAHVFAHSPISNLFFERMLDITGIDFLAIVSLGTVRITADVPNSWVRTLKTSVFLGIAPIVIFGVMRIYGMV